MIYDLAFVRPVDGEFISKRNWRSRERERKRAVSTGTVYDKQVFPGPKVSEFLVSKDFLVFAVRTYVHSHPADTAKDYFSVASSDNIFTRSAKDIVADSWVIYNLFRYASSMDKLSVRMCRFDFSTCKASLRAGTNNDSDESSDDDAQRLEESVISTVLTEDDFVELLEWCDRFEGLENVTEFRFIDNSPAYRLSQEQTAIFQENLRTLEGFLRSRIIAPMPTKTKGHTTSAINDRLTEAIPSPTDGFAVQSTRMPVSREPPRRQTAATVGPRDSMFDAERVQVPRSPPNVPHTTPKTNSERKTLVSSTLQYANVCGKRSRSLVVEDIPQLMPKRRKVVHAATSMPLQQRWSTSPQVGTTLKTYGRPNLPSRVTSMSRPIKAHEVSPQLSSSNLPTAAETSILSGILPELERLLDTDNPTLTAWVMRMKASGKL